MLEKLRREIGRFTTPLKSPIKRYVTRVIVIPTSSTFSHLKKWFELWFPLEEKELQKLYRWIEYSEDNDQKVSKTFLNHIKIALLDSFDVKLEGDLTEKGYRLFGSMNQILILSDLTEEDSVQNVQSVVETIKEEAKTRWPQVPIHIIGIFLLKKIVEKNGHSDLKVAQKFHDKMKSLIGSFNRIFLLDVSNKHGTTIHSVTDLHFLMAHVIYTLLRKPIEFINKNDVGGFTEWIRRDSPSEGRFTGFSGETMVVPIDELVETILISKSGEVLEETLLTKSPKFDTYVNSVLESIKKDHYLYNYESLKERLLNYSDPELHLYTLEIREILERWGKNPETFITTAELLDKRIYEYIEANAEILKEIAERVLTEFKHGYSFAKKFKKGLYDHIEYAISGYQAGLLVAQESLENLLDHFYDLGEEVEKKPPLSDLKIDHLIEDLRELIMNAPSTPQTILRSIVLLIVSVISFLFVDIPFLWKAVIFGAVPLIAIINSVVKVIIYRDKILKKYEQIKTTLQKKWDNLLENKVREMISQMLRRKKEGELKTDLLQPVEELITEVKEARERLEFLINYFKNEYFTETIRDSSYWRNILKGREEFMNFKPLLDELYDRDKENYISKFIPENMEDEERPLRFWKRFDPPSGKTSPNIWEWELAQNVAISLIPYTEKLLKLSICRVIKDYKPQELVNYIEILKRSVDPFILLKPGASTGTYIATLEIPAGGCEGIDTDVMKILSYNVHKLEKLPSNSPYRMTIVNLAEGLELENLYLED